MSGDTVVKGSPAHSIDIAESVKADARRSENLLIDFFAGTIAGIAGVIVGHPFDTVKVRLQSQDAKNPKYKGAIDCTKQTIQQEGIAGLFKGISSPIAGEALITCIVFGSYGIMQRLIQKDAEKPLTIGQTFIAGLGTGLAAATIVSPIELIKVKLQVQTEATKEGRMYKGPIDCTKKVWRSSGLRGIFNGLSATLIRDVPGFGIYFGSYEYFRKVFANKEGELSPWRQITAGGLAGMLSWGFAHPPDVVKTRMQALSSNNNTDYNGFWRACKYLYKTEGASVFARGLGPNLIRSFPCNAAIFYVYEVLMKASNDYLKARRNNSKY